MAAKIGMADVRAPGFDYTGAGAASIDCVAQHSPWVTAATYQSIDLIDFRHDHARGHWLAQVIGVMHARGQRHRRMLHLAIWHLA